MIWLAWIFAACEIKIFFFIPESKNRHDEHLVVMHRPRKEGSVHHVTFEHYRMCHVENLSWNSYPWLVWTSDKLIKLKHWFIALIMISSYAPGIFGYMKSMSYMYTRDVVFGGDDKIYTSSLYPRHVQHHLNDCRGFDSWL